MGGFSGLRDKGSSSGSKRWERRNRARPSTLALTADDIAGHPACTRPSGSSAGHAADLRRQSQARLGVRLRQHRWLMGQVALASALPQLLLRARGRHRQCPGPRCSSRATGVASRNTADAFLEGNAEVRLCLLLSGAADKRTRPLEPTRAISLDAITAGSACHLARRSTGSITVRRLETHLGTPGALVALHPEHRRRAAYRRTACCHLSGPSCCSPG